MKILKSIVAISLLLTTFSCASTKEYRGESSSSDQKTLNKICFVRIVNNSSEQISYTFNKVYELNNSTNMDSNNYVTNDQNNGTLATQFNFSVSNLDKNKEELIKIKRGDSLKIKYIKSGASVEEEIKINDDRRLDISNTGIISSQFLKITK